MLNIEPTKSTPKVLYLENEKTLEISGESYPENSFTFFEPLFQWLETALPQLTYLTLKVNIRYMNSSSTKCLLDVLDLLVDAQARGTRVSVLWYYEAGNDRALDLAEEFREDLTLSFEIIPLPVGETP